jgi:hypothetical protein
VKVLIVSHCALDNDKIAEFSPSEGDKKTKGRSNLASLAITLTVEQEVAAPSSTTIVIYQSIGPRRISIT